MKTPYPRLRMPQPYGGAAVFYRQARVQDTFLVIFYPFPS